MATLWLSIIHAVCQEAPVVIADSRSPNGRMELWIVPEKNEGIAVGTAEIRDVKIGRTLGTFDWSGFGTEADKTAFKVLWRPDSKFFAISWEETRGWMTGTVFGISRNGKWNEIGLPKDEYTKAIMKLGGVSDLYGKGCETPLDWLANGDLELEFMDRNLAYDHEDLEKEFIVELRVASRKDTPLSSGTIVSIRQKTKEQVEQELQSR